MDPCTTFTIVSFDRLFSNNKPSKCVILFIFALVTGALQEKQIAFCCREVTRGLVYLHGRGMMHRDIKVSTSYYSFYSRALFRFCISALHEVSRGWGNLQLHVS